MKNITYQTIFIIILIIILIIYCLKYLLIYNETFKADNINNLFNKPISNIFLTDNYLNYEINKPEINKKTENIEKIAFNTFLYSKPTSQKIICSSHTSRADCWEDNYNNCQWVYKIDNNSYCDVAPIWLL